MLHSEVFCNSGNQSLEDLEGGKEGREEVKKARRQEAGGEGRMEEGRREGGWMEEGRLVSNLEMNDHLFPTNKKEHSNLNLPQLSLTGD